MSSWTTAPVVAGIDIPGPVDDWAGDAAGAAGGLLGKLLDGAGDVAGGAAGAIVGPIAEAVLTGLIWAAALGLGVTLVLIGSWRAARGAS